MPRPGLADARPSLRKRRRRDRLRRLRPLLIVGGVVALAVVMAVVVWVTPVFSLREVRVQGNTVLTADQVRERAQAPMGRPLARVKVQQISDRVATLPQVESVRVRQAWPSSVEIDVVERTPVLQRRAAQGYQWIDRSGVVFATTDQPKSGLLVAETQTTDTRLLADLATVATALTPTLRDEVTGLSADSPDTITVSLKGGRKLVWGSAQESATKAQVATALLQVKAKVYDVSSPANPTSR